MANFALMPDETYIIDCETVFFNGNAFPPRGRLILTNMRIVYMKISTGTFVALGPLLSKALDGKPEFELPLAYLINVVPAKARGNRCLKFTLNNWQEFTFAVNKKFEQAFFGLSAQPR